MARHDNSPPAAGSAASDTRDAGDASADADRTGAPPVAAPPALSLRADLLWLPKAGNSVEEYEDAWAATPGDDPAPDTFSCAVADGATETSFSGLWARLLAEAYRAGGTTPDRLFAALPVARAEWRRAVAAVPLPWYAEEKARQGAFAALVGLTLDVDPAGAGGPWTALAVGDSCLFQARGDALLAAFPLAESAGFTNRPSLLSSDPSGDDALDALIGVASGAWLPGDRFYLLTDALACWFLAAYEAGEAPWRILDALGEAASGDEFIAWVADLRAARALRNDDVTLLAVRV